MRKVKTSFKGFTVYVMAIMMIMSLVVFPSNVYGVDRASGMVALKASNGQYLCAENGGGSILTANRDKIGEWETFQLVSLGKGYVALKGYNGDYVGVSNNDKSVSVNSNKVGQWNRFQLITLGNNKIALKTHNKKYICAENGGGDKVVADRKEIGEWETFEMVAIESDAIDFDKLEYVALVAANGKYLCAEDGGDSDVVANRGAIGSWETFKIIEVGTNTAVLQTSNGNYLYLQDERKGTINAKATKINDRTKFVFSRLEDNKVTLKASNGKYVVLDGEEIVATSQTVNKWSTFRMGKVQNSNFDKCSLTAIANDRSTQLSWSKPANTQNIIGYNLYRGTSSGRQSSTPITDFPIEGTSYTDKNLEDGETYYYIVKAVYRDKTEGTASNEVSVVLKTRIDLNAKLEERGIYLYWDKPSHVSGIIGYNLYRGTRWGKQSSTPITDFPIEGRSYTDKNVEDDTTYYYILKPVYKDKTLGMASNEVSIKYDSNDKTIVLEVGSRYMIVDGRRSQIDPGKGTAMVIKNGRAFLPIRAVIEAMDGEVEWDASDKQASIYLNSDRLYLWIGSKTAKVNGVTKESDVAPYISESGRTMLPLRFIVENLGFEADWDGVTQKVTIRVD